ncbi:MAG TPA: DUF4215 domain-containing protein [Kofleriaceae bacterium]
MRVAIAAAVLLAAAHGDADTLDRAGWRSVRDHATGVPAQLWGQVNAPGSVRDPAIAERAARQFLAGHIAELAPGARASGFTLVANRLDDNLRTLGFVQTAHGLRVVGAQIGFVFGHDRLFAIVSTVVPNVSVALPRTRAPGPRVVIRAGNRDHVADVVEVQSGIERWQVYRAADGSELGRRPLVMTETATLQYNAPVRYGWGPRNDFPAAQAAITVDTAATTTAADGTFMWTGTAAASVAPGLTGPYVSVINAAGALATTTLTAQPNSSVVWTLAGNEYGDAQLSAFIHASIAKTRARRISTSAATWLDAQLAVHVNEQFSACNAYSTGDDIHFLRGASSCENTARVADIVYHEFAHSLHRQAIIAGMGDWEVALSEGLSDFYAALITEDSGVGRGFNLTNNPGREIDPVGVEHRYPQHVSSDPHITGLIIAGALWDLRKLLIATHGATDGTLAIERIFAAVMSRAPTIPASYMAALIGDDDDSNLANGTPNLCSINAAFAAHGLFTDTQPTTVGPVHVDGLTIELPVDSPGGCTSVTGVNVTWQSSEGASGSFALAAQGAMWTGAFPEQPDRSLLLYSVTATFADGSTRTLPDNPADPMYQHWVGKVTPIWCSNMDTDPMWRRTSAQMALAWQWGPPTGAGGDPVAAYSGTNVLGTVLASDGLYERDEFAYVETPIMDLALYQTARLQYWRWLTVEAGSLDEATIAVRPEHVIATSQTVEVWHNSTAVNHVDKEWRFHDVDLTAMKDEPFYLRWVLESNAGTQLGGWAIDDVCVVTVDASVCGDHEISQAEQCDDGNREDGDGCSKLCTAEDGGCCSASSNSLGPLGPLALAALLGFRLRRRRRP